MRLWFLFFLVIWQNAAFAQKTERHLLADSLHKQAVKLSIDGERDTALVVIESALQLIKEVGIPKFYIQMVSDKIEIQRGLTDLEGALKTIESADSMVLNSDKTPYSADYYSRKAATLYELKDKEGALEAIANSREISIAFNDSLNRQRNLTVEGAIYRDLGRLAKAARVLKQLRFYAMRDKRNDHLSMSHFNLTQVYLDLQMPDSALIFINEFFSIDHSVAGLHIEELMVDYKARAYRLKNDYKKADEAMAQLMNMRMKRMDELESKKVEEANIRTRNEVMRYKNLTLKTEKKNTELKSQRNRVFFWSLTLFLLLLTIGAVYRQRNIKKAHDFQQNINKELSNSVEFKNKLLSILAHDIRNPINSLSGLISLFKDDTLDEKEFKALTQKLEGTTRNVSLLIENILNWIKAQGSGFDVRLSEFSLNELVLEVEKQNSAQLTEKGIGVVKSFDSTLGFIKSDYNIVSLIVRNVMANAIKFSNKNEIIEVKYENTVDWHKIIVSDNGIGMSQEQVTNLFGSKKSALGTNKETGTGLGLNLCQDLVNELRGKIDVKSVLGKGTSIFICLPIN
ncbi:MAG: hypothetical protein JXQ87_06390 [Bacteroidia bacterium]